MYQAGYDHTPSNPLVFRDITYIFVLYASFPTHGYLGRVAFED